MWSTSLDIIIFALVFNYSACAPSPRSYCLLESQFREMEQHFHDCDTVDLIIMLN